MRESIGGSMLLYLVVIFVGLVIVFFVGILSYSKAYRVKNRIVEMIEKYGSYSVVSGEMNDVIDEINPDLMNAGYNTSLPNRCNSTNVQNHLKEILNNNYVNSLPQNINNYGYNYCVFEIDAEDYPKQVSNGRYYIVVTFVQFEVPIIGDVLTFPVYGETKILGKSYDY